MAPKNMPFGPYPFLRPGSGFSYRYVNETRTFLGFLHFGRDFLGGDSKKSSPTFWGDATSAGNLSHEFAQKFYPITSGVEESTKIDASAPSSECKRFLEAAHF